MSGLTVYKASAGSGKTFRLTREYLKLLFDSVYNYKRILAVTFTNKAAGEMKNRIISQLDNLAKGNEALLNQISKETGLSKVKIKEKSELALKVILHDYSRFSIGTIDSFFQRVIRSFAKEMGLPFGYVVELDNEKILDEAIDRLLMSIDSNELLKSWLIKFSENKMEEGAAWDFKKDVHKLAKEIFKEGYALFDSEFIRKISEKGFLSGYSQELRKLKNRFENYLKNIGAKALKIIADQSLSVEDFSHKEKGVAGYFKKIMNKKDFVPGVRALNALGDPEKWYSKSSDKKELLHSIVETKLNSLLHEAVEYYSTEQRAYNTSKIILNFIYSLGILSDISHHIKEYNEEKNIFLLSDSSKFLRKIIGDNESPFIYEKTGSFYKYFMIDEFQDTSVLQWENFKPLIANSLSEGNSNLLVGDVKQAIYRWRNSDWKILAERIEKEFVEEQFQTRNLKINWRSKKNIIDFNNLCFHHASGLLQDKFNQGLDECKESQELEFLKNKIVAAYSDYFQESPLKKDNQGGYVQLKFLEESDEHWKDHAKKEVTLVLESLQDRGCKLSDIAILVRSKKEGKEIAETLIQHKKKSQDKYCFDFISNDSLFIKNSSSVRILLGLLTYFINPDDKINKAFIVHEYARYIKKNDEVCESLTQFFEEGENAGDDWFFKNLPDEFNNSFAEIKKESLCDLLEKLILIFDLHKNENELPYSQAFQELALDYSRKYTGDISSFLEWWSEAGENKTLPVSDQQDAIQILTIHKSKGLEFKAVIIPFCDWEFEQTCQTNILWCKPPMNPFNKLDVVPVKYSSKLADTIFYEEYFEEKMQSFVDNLNVMYVAFTRAEEELYVFSKKGDKKSGRCKNTSELLYSILERSNQANDLVETSSLWDHEKGIFQMGKVKSEYEAVESFERKQFSLKSYEVSDFLSRLKLNLHSKDYFLSKENEVRAKMNRGKIMHELFSKIVTISDLRFAVNDLVMSGKLTRTEGEDVEVELKELLQDEKIKQWFTDDWKVKNEVDILLKDGKIKRPDRVIFKGKNAKVIDYKFGDSEKKKYIVQVKDYVACLKEMGYNIVEGYVWYVNLGRVVSI